MKTCEMLILLTTIPLLSLCLKFKGVKSWFESYRTFYTILGDDLDLENFGKKKKKKKPLGMKELEEALPDNNEDVSYISNLLLLLFCFISFYFP